MGPSEILNSAKMGNGDYVSHRKHRLFYVDWRRRINKKRLKMWNALVSISPFFLAKFRSLIRTDRTGNRALMCWYVYPFVGLSVRPYISSFITYTYLFLKIILIIFVNYLLYFAFVFIGICFSILSMPSFHRGHISSPLLLWLSMGCFCILYFVE